MYGIDQTTSEGGAGYTGIQENFELTGITYGGTGKDGVGAVGLMFHFKRGEKFNVVGKVYPVDESKVTPFKNAKKDGTFETKAEAIKRAYDDKNTYIKHILSKFMPSADVVIPVVKNFEEYAKAIIALAGTKYLTEKFRLKLTYNKKGYLGLPDYPRFIENMKTPKEKSELVITARDILVKPTPDAPATGTPAVQKEVKEF